MTKHKFDAFRIKIGFNATLRAAFLRTSADDQLLPQLDGAERQFRLARYKVTIFDN